MEDRLAAAVEREQQRARLRMMRADRRYLVELAQQIDAFSKPALRRLAAQGYPGLTQATGRSGRRILATILFEMRPKAFRFRDQLPDRWVKRGVYPITGTPNVYLASDGRILADGRFLRGKQLANQIRHNEFRDGGANWLDAIALRREDLIAIHAFLLSLVQDSGT